MENEINTDIVIVGAGLAGLVAATEAAAKGRRVIIVEQEPEASLGGQAYWSFGALFLVNTPEQRRFGIRDSRDLALQDWLSSAGFDRTEDAWPRKWAEAYVDFAAGEMRSWLIAQGMRFIPYPQWVERGGYLANGHGNTVPRAHIPWGAGVGAIEPFTRKAKQYVDEGKIKIHFRHCVKELIVTAGVVTGVKGEILEASTVRRGTPSSRVVIGEFAISAQAVIITSGGIGGNLDLVRKYWPKHLSNPPKELLCGVPAHVDGQMLAVAEVAGSKLINMDRMWHYPEGVHYHAPIWPHHAMRVISGPSPLWLDARGNRLPAPLFPVCDTYGALKHIIQTGYRHSWFVLNHKILKKEFRLSGSDQNPDIANKNLLKILTRAWNKPKGPLGELLQHCKDFVVNKDLDGLVQGMNDLVGEELITRENLKNEIKMRDQQVSSGYGKDEQIMMIREARRYLPDRFLRVAKLDRIDKSSDGPFVAVRLTILTRKTLGGLATDLSARVLKADGEPLPGLYAAGEVTGFGGGGMLGYRALEGTFLGGCLLGGRIAGREAADML